MIAGARRDASRCPVCGHSTRPLAGSCPDAWICASCAHTFVATLPSAAELEEAYAKYRYDDEAARAKEVPAYLARVLDEVVASFAPHRTTGRFLDVGFGDGGFLQAAGRQGWDCHGIEFSEGAVEAGRRRKLGTLYAGAFTDVPLEPASFDVIVMSEVIEHLLDPAAALTHAATLLRRGGLLYMTTPHGRGVSGRVLRGSWSVLCPPEHLQLYSIPSMRRALADGGFASSRVTTQGLLPHELIAWARDRVLPAPSPSSPDRVGKSHDLNAKFESGTNARRAKRAANTLLGWARAGDSLRVRAVR